MREYDTYPATRSNQITKEYYYTLLDQINRGTCSKKVQRITRRNGSHCYETYHLVSTR